MSENDRMQTLNLIERLHPSGGSEKGIGILPKVSVDGEVPCAREVKRGLGDIKTVLTLLSGSIPTLEELGVGEKMDFDLPGTNGRLEVKWDGPNLEVDQYVELPADATTGDPRELHAGKIILEGNGKVDVRDWRIRGHDSSYMGADRRNEVLMNMDINNDAKGQKVGEITIVERETEVTNRGVGTNTESSTEERRYHLGIYSEGEGGFTAKMDRDGVKYTKSRRTV